MTRSEDLGPLNSAPSYWLTGLPQQIAAGLCGIIAVLIALKSVAYDPSGVASNYDHFVRVLSFAALPVWITFTIGMSRRNSATIISLVFAVIVELLLVPTTHTGLSTITAANLGIVLSYCSLELYWRAVMKDKPSAQS